MTINAGCTFLSDQIDQLPLNCLFDKGKVGCGGTTIALTNNTNYVIAVPFVSLVENKTKQHTNVLGVSGTTTDKQIKNYLSDSTIPVKKIIVTYDSLNKLMGKINPSDYNILVDELHLLFTQYSFRKGAIRGVLEHYKKFANYTFMTATILEEDFVLEELKDIPIVVADWKDVAEVKVNSVKCNSDVTSTVVALINRFLTGEIEGNAYIFVNSIEFIQSLIKTCNLTQDNTRVIYSNYNKANIPIKRGLTTDKPKKINLLTSTVFEGCDIYDSDGKIYIVSDNKKAHTLIDIATSFQQIAGRIRNSKYAGLIHHIYHTTKYDVNVSYDEYKETCMSNITEAKELVSEINLTSSRIKNALDIDKLNDSYVNIDNDSYFFDANLVKIDLYNFKVTKQLYRLRYTLNNEYEKYNIKVQNLISNRLEEVLKEEDETNFKDVVLKLKEIDSSVFKSDEQESYKTWSYKKYPFLKEAIEVLGFDGIEKQGYIQTNIKRLLIAKSDRTVTNKILKQLMTYNLSSGTFIAASRLKDIFSKVYGDLGIKKTAKGSDIQQYFEVKQTVKTIEGKNIAGYTIIRQKVLLKA